MNTPFLNRESSAMFLLQEKADANGKHMEFRDPQGATFARMAKVYKEGWFLGLFSTFRASPPVHAELHDVAGSLLLATLSTWGATAHECTVEVFDQPAGTRIGTLHGAPFGADFRGPTGELLGRARRPPEGTSEPREVVHTYTDAAEQTVGTCDRRYPTRDTSTMGQANELMDFFYYGVMTKGLPVQLVTLTAPVDPVLHLFLHLFPALQNLRYTRSK